MENEQPTARFVVASFVVAGMFALARQFVGVFDPEYYDPSTVIDYSAVILMSAAFAGTSIALFLLRRRLSTHRLDLVLYLPATAAMFLAVGNLLEDGFGVEEAGEWGFIVGGIGVLSGLVLSGLIILATFGRDRWVGLALLLGIFFGIGDLIGVMGGAWLLMAWMLSRDRASIPTRPHVTISNT